MVKGEKGEIKHIKEEQALRGKEELEKAAENLVLQKVNQSLKMFVGKKAWRKNK